MAEGVKEMKKNLHPEFKDCTVTCDCGTTFKTKSTKNEIHLLGDITALQKHRYAWRYVRDYLHPLVDAESIIIAVGESEPFAVMSNISSMLSKYGVRNHRLHRGVDVRITMGEPIVAAFPGVVIVSKFNPGGYGHYVLVQHDNDIQTLYGHLSKREVKVGDKLLPGDIVGLGGNSGRTTGPHLHFEIRYGKYNIDPETVVDFPHWELTEGASRISKSDVITAHRKMQAKLKNEDYIVKEGDTLESIAALFNISVMSLCRTNNI